MRLLKTVEVGCTTCGATEAREVGRTRDFESRSCDNEFVFVECMRCGLTYLKNRPDVSELDIIYGSDYVVYSYNDYLGRFISRLRGIVQSLKIRAVRKYARPGCLIADVGCGNGELLRLIKRFGDRSWQLTGVDVSKEAIGLLERVGIEGRLGRFETLVWNGPRPRLIVMNQVIEHFEDPKAVVRRAYELLEPGGALILETPSLDGWDAMLFKKRYWGGWHTPRHWTLYTQRTLEDLLRSEKFEIVEAAYLANPYAWLQSFRFLFDDHYRLPRLAQVFQVNVLPMLMFATAIDVLQKLVRGKTSNLRLVARK